MSSLVLNLKLHLCFLRFFFFFFFPSPSPLSLVNTYHKSAIKLTSLYEEHESGNKRNLDCQLERQDVSSPVSEPTPSSAFSYRSTQILLSRRMLKKVQAAAELEHGVSEAEAKMEETKQDPTQPKLWLSETKQDTTRAFSPLYLRFVSSLFSSVSRVSGPRKERKLTTHTYAYLRFDYRLQITKSSFKVSTESLLGGR